MLNTRASLKMILNMDMECRNGQMDLDTRDNGTKARQEALESFITLMETCMKESL